MRYTILIVALFIVGNAMGCTPTEGKAAEKPMRIESSEIQLEKVKTETKEAVQAMQDYTFARRAEFVAEKQKELDEIQVELDLLSARVDRSKGEAKGDAKARLEAVREKWVGVKSQLAQTESVGEAAWDNVKRGFEISRDELKQSFDATRQWLSDKIEP